MADLTIVNTGFCEIDVHAAGCADLTRRPQYLHPTASRWDMTAASRREVVTDIYQGFEDLEPDGSNWREFTNDVHFFPCLGAFPDEPNP